VSKIAEPQGPFVARPKTTLSGALTFFIFFIAPHYQLLLFFEGFDFLSSGHELTRKVYDFGIGVTALIQVFLDHTFISVSPPFMTEKDGWDRL